LSYKVYIPQEIDPAGVSFLEERGYQIVSGYDRTDATLIGKLKECDALLLRNIQISQEIMSQAPKLKVISRYGAGYDNVDLKAAKELGIAITYSPVGNVNSVAEHALGFVIACARQFYRCDQATRTGNFGIRSQAIGCDLEGKKLGILGFGKIGSRLAHKAFHGLDMEIIVYDPYVKKDRFPSEFQLTDDLNELLRTADFVSIHMPVTAETRDMIGPEQFAMMKPSAHLINCCRGEIVDEKALIAALKNNLITGAGIDVFNPEPPDLDNELFSFDNVIFSPHNAGTTYESTRRVAIDCAKGIDDVLNGRTPEFPVQAG